MLVIVYAFIATTPESSFQATFKTMKDSNRNHCVIDEMEN